MIPLSFGQRRYWFLHQLEGGENWNMSAAFRLTGSLDQAALVVAIHDVVDRHEILRTTYVTDDDGEFVDLDVKGLEISTPVSGDVWEQQSHLVRQYGELQQLLADVGLRGVPYGAHVAEEEYVGPRGERTTEGWDAAETAMMTWGIHVNVSFPDSVEAKLDRAPRGLIVAVENAAPPRPAPPVPDSGLGLVGLAERLALAGGSVQARPRLDGGFLLYARIPADPPELRAVPA